MKARWVALLVFGAVGTAAAQTILRTELPEFHCYLAEARTGSHSYVVRSVERWKVGESEYHPPVAGLSRPREKYPEFSYLPDYAAARDVPGDNLLIVPLQETGLNQFQEYIVSFWRSEGDSLRLLAVAPHVRVAGPGHFRLGEARDAGGDRVAVFAESENIDAGERWGAVDVFVLDLHDESAKPVHSEDYKWELCAPSDSLAVSWTKGEGPVLRLVRRRFDVRDDPSVPVGCRNVAVDAETSYVDVRDLIDGS